MTGKIGVGIVTCNREEMFRKCVNSIPDCIKTLVVVNDATPYDPSSYPQKAKLIQNEARKPVGVSKNILLRYFMDGDFEHFFLLEDDIYITDPEVFAKYIKTVEVSGILHLNYGYHGSDNRDPNGVPYPRWTVDYGNDVKVALNFYVLGAFSYYHRMTIEKVGYMDERFNNALEHVEHTARIARAGFHPPFWWFADVHNSFQLIGELDPTQAQSVIRKSKKKDEKQIIVEVKACLESMGYIPQHMPQVSQDFVMLQLRAIQAKYAKKNLNPQ